MLKLFKLNDKQRCQTGCDMLYMQALIPKITNFQLQALLPNYAGAKYYSFGVTILSMNVLEMRQIQKHVIFGVKIGLACVLLPLPIGLLPLKMYFKQFQEAENIYAATATKIILYSYVFSLCCTETCTIFFTLSG